ncbi:MAG: ABC transporter permease, partial [Pseudohongiellaceae bacterium]
MFKNYFLTAVRNLFKNKLYSLINIVGFAVGMACVVLIVLYVAHELSYDRHWAKSDRIYKVMTTFMPTVNYAGLEIATSGSIISVLLEQEFPQVEEAVRLVGTGNLILSLPDDNTPFNEQGIYFADPPLSEVFDLPLVAGSWEEALEQPAQIVINESLAIKYFGRTDVVGQSLIVGNQAPARITAVMEDIEENTHLAANGFLSMATAVGFFGPDYTRSWIRQDFHTYVVLAEGYGDEQFQAEMPAFLERHSSDDPNPNTALEIMPVTDIHLRSDREFELGANGSMVTVYTFSAVAVFFLMIDFFNFMILSSARSSRLSREVGMLKT